RIEHRQATVARLSLDIARNAMGAEYTAVAEELRAILAIVQAGAWQGRTAEAYLAAHLPYLAWLTQASAESAELASRQTTAAGAYTAAVATMPTLAELAANHAAHQVLVATNFFGINAVSLSLNEAHYVRLWIQAATVMSTYQAITTAALSSAPQISPAPPIRKTNAPVATADPWLPLPVDRQNWIYQLLQQIGYIDFYDNFLVPFINLLVDNPFLQAMFSGIDPYLLILGNPLTYLNPFNIAFALGYPMDIATYVSLLSETFAFIGMDLAAAFASGNPMAIGLTIVFVTVEAIGTIITDTIALLKTLLEQTAIFFTIVVPMLLTPLAPLAAGAVLTPLGVKGLAALAAGSSPITPSLPGAALAPSMPTTSPPSAPGSATTTPATTALDPPTPPAATPPATGAGLGSGLGATMGNLDYLVGELTAKASRAAGTSTGKKAREPDNAELSAVGTTPPEQTRAQRRRRTKTKQLDYGDEYMDLEPDEQTRSAASDHGATNIGFAGTAITTRSGQAAGVRSVPSDAFGNNARTPMLPSSWATNPPDRIP
ncbi:MAG: PPE family protein, partial [Mycobacteriaceae bacterium]|nr:PPE family protein [Mycobacteriaceae bacterium]